MSCLHSKPIVCPFNFCSLKYCLMFIFIFPLLLLFFIFLLIGPKAHLNPTRHIGHFHLGPYWGPLCRPTAHNNGQVTRSNSKGQAHHQSQMSQWQGPMAVFHAWPIVYSAWFLPSRCIPLSLLFFHCITTELILDTRTKAPKLGQRNVWSCGQFNRRKKHTQLFKGHRSCRWTSFQ